MLRSLLFILIAITKNVLCFMSIYIFNKETKGVGMQFNAWLGYMRLWIQYLSKEVKDEKEKLHMY